MSVWLEGLRVLNDVPTRGYDSDEEMRRQDRLYHRSVPSEPQGKTPERRSESDLGPLQIHHDPTDEFDSPDDEPDPISVASPRPAVSALMAAASAAAAAAGNGDDDDIGEGDDDPDPIASVPKGKGKAAKKAKSPAQPKAASPGAGGRVVMGALAGSSYPPSDGSGGSKKSKKPKSKLPKSSKRKGKKKSDNPHDDYDHADGSSSDDEAGHKKHDYRGQPLDENYHFKAYSDNDQSSSDSLDDLDNPGRRAEGGGRSQMRAHKHKHKKKHNIHPYDAPAQPAEESSDVFALSSSQPPPPSTTTTATAAQLQEPARGILGGLIPASSRPRPPSTSGSAALEAARVGAGAGAGAARVGLERSGDAARRQQQRKQRPPSLSHKIRRATETEQIRPRPENPVYPNLPLLTAPASSSTPPPAAPAKPQLTSLPDIPPTPTSPVPIPTPSNGGASTPKSKRKTNEVLVSHPLDMVKAMLLADDGDYDTHDPRRGSDDDTELIEGVELSDVSSKAHELFIASVKALDAGDLTGADTTMTHAVNEAQKMAKSVLATNEDRQTMASTCMALGYVAFTRGNYSRAAKLYRKSAQYWERVHGKKSPLLLFVLTDKITADMLAKNWKHAFESLQVSLSICRSKELGPIKIAPVLWKSAICKAELGQGKEATEFFERSILVAQSNREREGNNRGLLQALLVYAHFLKTTPQLAEGTVSVVARLTAVKSEITSLSENIIKFTVSHSPRVASKVPDPSSSPLADRDRGANAGAKPRQPLPRPSPPNPQAVPAATSANETKRPDGTLEQDQKQPQPVYGFAVSQKKDSQSDEHSVAASAASVGIRYRGNPNAPVHQRLQQAHQQQRRPRSPEAFDRSQSQSGNNPEAVSASVSSVPMTSPTSLYGTTVLKPQLDGATYTADFQHKGGGGSGVPDTPPSL